MSNPSLSFLLRLRTVRFISALTFSTCAQVLLAQSAWVRVSQVGYEAGQSPSRAYLMATAPQTSATFSVINSQGTTVYSAPVGTQLGTWSHSNAGTYYVYALDFNAPAGDLYSISVSGPIAAESPNFAVDRSDVLYSGLLLNTLFFYETERDGPDFIRNSLRSAPGHLKDRYAQTYETPLVDSNDFNANTPPKPPLVPANLAPIDASGGWWDAGDYMKYVETVSYTAALMQIGIRDFPNQMGGQAPQNPPAPPGSVSYAGSGGIGAPTSSNFGGEANFGVNWLMKMWDDDAKVLYYQVDDSQDFDYYGEGDPSSAAGNCGGTYATPYCLITEYDIWILPQLADHYQQSGDPEPCDPFTSFFICNRPVYIAAPPGAPISPNLAGRLSADFALCYQLNRNTNPALADRCLKNAEHIFDLADLSFTDPAPSAGSGTCRRCLLTISPFDGYPENVWEDDMELGATELYFALQRGGSGRDLPAGLPHTDASYYLQQATQFAAGYIKNIYNAGYSDTLNLYDVSGLAHFELYRALGMAGDPAGLAISKESIRGQLLHQVGDAITQSQSDSWGFGYQWSYGDTTSHGAGISVMASEAFYLTQLQSYNTYSQRWLANILGANPWGSSFIVGDGSIFPNCIQHQVANLAGALNGTSGGTPVLWGAAVEGPSSYASSGVVDGMILCPANGVDTFKRFNGSDGAYNVSQVAVFRDNMQSYSTTEPGIDLTATSFLMWSWRLAQTPSF
jgi:endoglucanase